MRRALCAFAALALLVAPASAARWAVDHTKSRLGFVVQWSGEAFPANFKAWNADIVFDPADLAHSKAVVTIFLDSENSDTPDNDEGLKGAEGFATDRFPRATFETTSIVAKGGNVYVATGRLSLHGIVKTITLPFTLAFNGNSVHMVGKAVVSRIDFGLGSSGEFSGETPISHGVTITVDLTATKAR